MRIRPAPGDNVRVQMFDRRIVEGIVCPSGVFDTTAGLKIRFKSNDAIFLVGVNQIQRVWSRRFNVFLCKPGLSKKWYVSRHTPLVDAQSICDNFNRTHDTNLKRAEFEESSFRGFVVPPKDEVNLYTKGKT